MAHQNQGKNNQANVVAPAATIARVLGARAKLDAQIGWHKSISNTEINGVSGLKFARSFDILDANCEANTLNSADVSTLVREKRIPRMGKPHLFGRPDDGF